MEPCRSIFGFCARSAMVCAMGLPERSEGVEVAGRTVGAARSGVRLCAVRARRVGHAVERQVVAEVADALVDGVADTDGTGGLCLAGSERRVRHAAAGLDCEV